MGFGPPGGSSVPFNFTGSAYTPPASGSIDLDFTDATTQYVSPQGLDGSLFGGSSVVNQDQGALPSGISAGGIGAATVTFRNRTIQTEGFDSYRHGPYRVVDQSLRFLTASGLSAGAMGEPRSVYISFYRQPAGNAIYFNFAGDPYTPATGNAIYGDFVSTSSFRALFVSGIAPSGIGTPRADLQLTTLGINSAAFGTATVARPSQTITVNGFAAGAFGSHTVAVAAAIIAPTSLAAGAFGAATFRNEYEVLLPGGIAPPVQNSDAQIPPGRRVWKAPHIPGTADDARAQAFLINTFRDNGDIWNHIYGPSEPAQLLNANGEDIHELGYAGEFDFIHGRSQNFIPAIVAGSWVQTSTSFTTLQVRRRNGYEIIENETFDESSPDGEFYFKDFTEFGGRLWAIRGGSVGFTFELVYWSDGPHDVLPASISSGSEIARTASHAFVGPNAFGDILRLTGNEEEGFGYSTETYVGGTLRGDGVSPKVWSLDGETIHVLDETTLEELDTLEVPDASGEIVDFGVINGCVLVVRTVTESSGFGTTAWLHDGTSWAQVDLDAMLPDGPIAEFPYSDPPFYFNGRTSTIGNALPSGGGYYKTITTRFGYFGVGRDSFIYHRSPRKTGTNWSGWWDEMRFPRGARVLIDTEGNVYRPKPGYRPEDYIFGHRLIADRPPVRPAGFAATLFGGTRIELFNRPLPVPGTVMTRFGQHLVAWRVRYVQPQGFTRAVFGSPSIAIIPRPTLYPQGIMPPGFGTPRITPHTIYAPSFSSFAFGFGNGGIDVRSVRWPQTIVQFDAYLGPKTTSNTLVELRNRTIAPVGFGVPRFGAAELTETNYTRSLNPSGMPAGPFGAHELVSLRRLLEPSSIEAGSVSTYATIFRDEFGLLYPYPINPSAVQVASPIVRLQRRYIQPSGFTQAQISSALSVTHRARRLFVQGFDASLHSSASDVSHDLRYISVPTMGPLLAFGGPSVMHRTRTVITVGSIATRFGLALLGYDRPVVPAGFVATGFGLANVHDNSQRVDLLGNGIHGDFGMPTVELYKRYLQQLITVDRSFVSPALRVYNLRQYLAPYADTPTTWGPYFGNFNLVENRNRTVRPSGWLSQKVPNGALIENKARALLVSGAALGRFGSGSVTHRIRYLYPDGIEAPPILRWLNVRNNARILAAAGGAVHSLFGTPGVLNRNRFLPLPSLGVTSTFGMGMVAFRIREITFYQGIPAPAMGAAHIYNLKQYISPTGFDWPDETGAHHLEIHRTIIAPRFTVQTRYGEPMVYNKTPQLFQMGRVETMWGGTKIRLQYRFLPAQGSRTDLYGRPDVSYRTKRTYPLGILSLRIGLQRVALVQPDLPFPRSIEPMGFSIDDEFHHGIGSLTIRGNSLFPPGIEVDGYGRPTVYLIGIRPPSISPDFSSQVGFPLVNPWFSVRPPGINPIMPSRTDNGTNFGGGPNKHRVDPHIIWCRFDTPTQAQENHPESRLWTYMDTRFLPAGDSGRRPIFGATKIENKNRTIRHIHGSSSSTPGIFTRYGLATVALRCQYVRPAGFRAFKQGIPELFGGTRLFQFYGFDMSLFGLPTVDFYVAPGTPRTLRPAGLLSYVTGAPVIQLKNRTLRPSGIAPISVPRPTRIGPPIYPAPAGIAAAVFGTAWVSLYIRTVFAEGQDQALVGYSFGSFLQRMRVRHRDRYTVGGIVFTQFGAASVVSRVQGIRQTDEIQRGGVGIPACSTRNIIALGGLGLDAGAFGDVDRWEAGKLKPHGDNLARYGLPRTKRGINTVGINGVFGAPRVARPIRPDGFASLVTGTPAAPLANPHGCGSTARAIVPPPLPTAGFGSPTIQ